MFEGTSGPGNIGLMLLIVLLLGLVFYGVGVLAMGYFRRGRLNEETDIAYPDTPQSDTDRRAVAHIHAHEKHEDMVVPADERELGGGQRAVRQSPTQVERPVDRADRQGTAPEDPSSHSPL